MLMVLSEFLFASLVVILAALLLTRSADVLTKTTKMSGAIAGALLLASATSLPELSVSVSAVLLNLEDVAVGGLIGSSLCNLGILGFLDMSRHSKGRMLSRMSANHAVAGLVSIFLTSLVAIFIFTKIDLSVGTLSVHVPILIITYVIGFILIQRTDKEVGLDQEEKESKNAVHKILGIPVRTKGAIVAYVVAALVIFLAAPRMSASAGELAELTGISKTFIGTLLVAMATSLPELVTTLGAVRLKSFDMAIGNIFGSNGFNMVLLTGADLAYTGSLFANVSSVHVLTCVAVTLVTTVTVLGQLYPVESRKRFVEPDAAAIILFVLGAMGLIYYVGG